jgi:hypothetical protein
MYGAHISFCERDPERLTRLLTDASKLAVSATLEQTDGAGVLHP